LASVLDGPLSSFDFNFAMTALFLGLPAMALRDRGLGMLGAAFAATAR
jgi:hypothetical protein